MGHGVKQRDVIRMTPAEVDAFIHERRPMTMCTLNHDGSIHAVAMWYGFLDGSIAIETKAKAQKAVNLGRDPRITCMFEDGEYYEELRGVELVGRAEIIDDPDKMFELGVNLFERYYGAYTDDCGRSSRPCSTNGSWPRSMWSAPSRGTTGNSAFPRPGRPDRPDQPTWRRARSGW